MSSGRYYQQEWERYRTLRTRFLIVTVSMTILSGLSLAIVILNLGAIERDVLIWTIFSLTLAVLASRYSMLMLQRWKCPRCGNPFHGSLFFPKIFTPECQNCGLRQYEGSIFDRRAE